jgi:hypothetical protein
MLFNILIFNIINIIVLKEYVSLNLMVKGIWTNFYDKEIYLRLKNISYKYI